MISWAMRGSLREIHDGIQLLSYRDDEDFINKTRAALNFIRSHDPLNYARIRRFLDMVTDLGFAGGYYDSDRRAYHADQFEARDESTVSYAAGIIHEAIHGRLERCRIPYRGNEARHENLCKQVQARFLDKVGEHRLANMVRSSEEWWLVEAVRSRRAAFLEHMRHHYRSEGGMHGFCLARFYGVALGKQNRESTLKPLRQYKQNQFDALEFDCDRDGKADQWEYYEEGVLKMIELDSQRGGWVNQRTVYSNGELCRIENLKQDGTTEHLGFVKHSKQGTRKEIYWTTPEGHLTAIQLYIGTQLIGKAIVDDKGTVIETKGQPRYRVGQKVVISGTICLGNSGATILIS